MKTNGELYVRTKQSAHTVRLPVNLLELKKKSTHILLNKKTVFRFKILKIIMKLQHIPTDDIVLSCKVSQYKQK